MYASWYGFGMYKQNLFWGAVFWLTFIGIAVNIIPISASHRYTLWHAIMRSRNWAGLACQAFYFPNTLSFYSVTTYTHFSINLSKTHINVFFLFDFDGTYIYLLLELQRGAVNIHMCLWHSSYPYYIRYSNMRKKARRGRTNNSHNCYHYYQSKQNISREYHFSNVLVFMWSIF